MPGSIENIVRRHLYHGSATGFSRCSQIAGSYMVQLVAELRIILRLVYRRISCTVHNDIHPVAGHKCAYGLFVTYIQFLNIRKKVGVLPILSGKRPHLITKLSVGTGY